ncbi:KxYKxGKxW signal peptide domain-containing protein [Fructilactobacillus ixorae]|uniref:KxYKxGKxW signal peptide domain-containing protein n=1 Tax=Fructilactobacillus ixorae TaxID=1750535 RepID=A0ABY5C3J5_9LACO|nr:KxYKxGKxW signal peptide domain-containing protein [Fructilactobacillus ixorae]USS93351.1 KxYKxGKxW signal peptide domain-containing protein [Fructilactobacillus ixorae]
MENKIHYKMYKAGKIWLFASISTVALGIGLFGTPNASKVHADVSPVTTNQEPGTTSTEPKSPNSVTNESSQGKPTYPNKNL